ncbi:Random slug protein 5 [Heracleum sosnowskyi]|uniref:Random slug protein 5 n=1 Tax=Heracleum sosnowskyi TaxID=360622 RepID=A0AAD8ISN5_9APIA|nr:Random slug protein 5 [Heracleum sosnowskyi]
MTEMQRLRRQLNWPELKQSYTTFWGWLKRFLNQKVHKEVSVEGETRKLFRADFHDCQGRTVLILKPGLQYTTSIDNQIRHLVYLIENAILNLPEGQEQMAWLIDFTGWSFSTSARVKSSRDTISILQNYYPEILAVAFLYNPPRIFEPFWKVVKYFLDTKTFHKKPAYSGAEVVPEPESLASAAS